MGNTDAARSAGANDGTETASLDELMPDALTALVTAILVPGAARRRAIAAAEALLMEEMGEAPAPPSGRRKTPSSPCTLPPDSA